MMNYEEFKAKVIDNFAMYLPEKYKGSKVSVNIIPKINREMEAINVECPIDVLAQPILYLQGLYGDYMKSKDVDIVLKSAATVFSYYSTFLERVAVGLVEEEINKYNIIINLIGTERNRHLLDSCPHHQELDMTIIYRQVVFLEDGSYNGSIITNEDMKSLAMTEEELYSLALENTERMFPAEIDALDDNIYKISNYLGSHGAVTMLYPGFLGSIANEWEDDLYVIPSSIHEIILIAVTGQDADRLRALVVGANLDLVKDPVILTDSIYHYSQETKKLTIASYENKGPVS